MSNNDIACARYRDAAIKRYEQDDDFEIKEDAEVSLGPNGNGAWVSPSLRQATRTTVTNTNANAAASPFSVEP